MYSYSHTLVLALSFATLALAAPSPWKDGIPTTKAGDGYSGVGGQAPGGSVYDNNDPDHGHDHHNHGVGGLLNVFSSEYPNPMFPPVALY